MFQACAGHLPPSIELRALRMPGRRTGFVDCAAAADALAAALAPGLEQPYVLFGHSMGALIADELIVALDRRGLPRPALYVPASWPAVGITLDRLPDPDQSDEAFLAGLVRLGGVAPGVLADPEVRAYTLPALRADFRLCRTHRYRPPRAPMDVPILAMGGVADPVTPLADLADWRHRTTHFMGVRGFPGGHFFVRDLAEQLGQALGEAISAVLGRSLRTRRPPIRTVAGTMQ